MLRAAAWTCGLFSVGAGVVHWMPSSQSWLEPVVLAVLGLGLIIAGGKRSPAPGSAGSRISTDITGAERAAR